MIDRTPTADPDRSEDCFEVLIVCVEGRLGVQATIERASYRTTDASAARNWADTFNEFELAEPIGAWAVVRRIPAARP
jgi:hypothetical protein